MTACIIEYKIPNLGDEFKAFQDLSIYGTEEEPLFVGAEVRRMLRIPAIDYDDYEEGEDYIICQCANVDGVFRDDDQNMFTEDGLYHIITKSQSDMGKAFRKFVKIAVRGLRLNGKAKMQDSVTQLQNEIKEKDKKILHLETVCKCQKENFDILAKYHGYEMVFQDDLDRMQEEMIAMSELERVVR